MMEASHTGEAGIYLCLSCLESWSTKRLGAYGFEGYYSNAGPQ
jgi:hypothetical protein